MCVMSLSLTTAPTTEPITLAELKEYARVMFTRDDKLLDGSVIPSARQLVELVTHRALITQTYTLTLSGFPLSAPIVLPRPPLSSVTSVQYVDNAGSTQTWDSSKYTVVTPSGDHASHGWIEPAYSEVYPSTRQVPEAVTITYVAGYGAASAVPGGLKMAVREAGAEIYSQAIDYERLRMLCAPWVAWRDDLRYA